MSWKMVGNIARLAAIMAFSIAMLFSLMANTDPFAAAIRAGIGSLVVGAVVWLSIAVSFAVIEAHIETEEPENEDDMEGRLENGTSD